MRRSRALLIAIVVAGFVAVGGFVAFRGIGAGGRQVTVNATVTGSSMKPDRITVRQGDHVTMTVSADRAEEIHLHGYDIKFEAAPGKPATHTFTADKTGSFDIEIEDRSTGVGSLVVQP